MIANREEGLDESAYQAFLKDIGYILLMKALDFSIETTQVDDEIATIAGPQLVVPVMNARYALNGTVGISHDALYGMMRFLKKAVLKKAPAITLRVVKKVIHAAREFLDAALLLSLAHGMMPQIFKLLMAHCHYARM